ncbi:MAG: SpoIIE family protein phosphatase [Planctomycetota bacterium]
MAQLIFLEGVSGETSFMLSDSTVIGQDPSSTIVITNSAIAPKQLSIKKKNGKYSINNLHQKCKLIINGKELQQADLQHGDMINIANITILYNEDLKEPENRQEDPALQVGGSMGEEISPSHVFTTSVYDAKDVLKSFEGSARPEQRLATLFEVSAAIMNILNLNQLLDKLLDIIFDHFPADRASIWLMNDKKLQPTTAKIRGKGKITKVAGTVEISKTIFRTVLKNKESILTQNAMEDDRFNLNQSIIDNNMHSVMCVPLLSQNKNIIGMIHCDSTKPGSAFTRDDLNLLTSIGMQSTMAIENARLYAAVGESERLAHEVRLASNIQRELLPANPPSWPGLDVYGIMLPAKEVGGDYYDFIRFEEKPDNPCYICVGDVSGKGVPAGLIMVMAKSFLLPIVSKWRSPRQILIETNQMLCSHSNIKKQNMFMSFLLLCWEPQEGRMTYSGAGHEHIVFYSNSRRKASAVRTGGMALGLTNNRNELFEEKTIPMESGDMILLYTDGATEAMNPQGVQFGLKNIAAAVAQSGHESPKTIVDRLLSYLNKHRGTTEQWDDITLVAIKRL